MWSVALATPPGLPPDLALCAAFGAGAFVMRGAGCTVNDLWDREIDRQVERTRMRPLASGAVSVPAAIGFLGAQLTCGLGVLLTLPPSMPEVRSAALVPPQRATPVAYDACRARAALRTLVLTSPISRLPLNI
jgi:4-hydroxybenzoate polyprenyltransferase|tara:strand:+ start:238 stop:636 length:399 start_codon:yes stop_codon:yes gene_type:complete